MDKTIIARYSPSLMCRADEDFKDKARKALAQLFITFGRDILDNKDIDFTKDHEIELFTEQEHWDQHFVLKLIRRQEDVV